MKGLTSHQAEQLLKQYGLNILEETARRTKLKIFLEQFNNFFTYLLFSASLISFFVGDQIDGILILTIIILNALFGLYQEAKAANALAALKKLTISRVRVLRDGQEKELDSKYLVPGDILIFNEGDKIPADCILLEAINLELNEAPLTGESVPVYKNIQDEVFMGTIIVKGRGVAKILQTGMRTKFGSIAQKISKIEETKTPLQKKLISLSKTIGFLGLVAALTVFILSLYNGHSSVTSLLLAISLAVAVVPEGLPAVITITLSIGVKEMAKKKAILRKLSSIEALGSLTLIATDKTGTLTTNKMEVKHVFVDRTTSEPFQQLLLNGILCSTSTLVYTHGTQKWDVLGDPTEGALLLLAQKNGLQPQEIKKDWQLLHEEPFDSVTKRMSVIVGAHHDAPVNRTAKIFTKGAPESTLALCSKIQIGDQHENLTETKRMEIQKVIDKWAGEGLRILAFGYKNSKQLSKLNREDIRFEAITEGPSSEGVGGEKRHIERFNKNCIENLIVNDFVFLGLVAIHDPPRPEVREAVQKARLAGLKVVMITGDNEKTAEAIGTSCGLIKIGDEIITGRQLDEYTDQALLKKLDFVKIFARTTPLHKFRIVELFQKKGEVVAVTGDGINDAIALKQADVGIAMGLIGTDVARETADMIITDDNFATIINALEQGRNTLKNLKNTVKYLLAGNLAEAATIISGLFLGLPNLFLATQILYINLISDGIPALALGFTKKEKSLLKNKAEKEINLLDKSGKIYIGLIGVLTTVLVISAYYFYRGLFNEEIGKTAAFTVLTLSQSFVFVDLWLNHESVIKNLTRLKRSVFLVSFLSPFLIHYLVVTSPFLTSVFKISPLPFSFYVVLIVFSSMILPLIKLLNAKLH